MTSAAYSFISVKLKNPGCQRLDLSLKWNKLEATVDQGCSGGSCNAIGFANGRFGNVVKF